VHLKIGGWAAKIFIKSAGISCRTRLRCDFWLYWRYMDELAGHNRLYGDRMASRI
jgi:hypothetical protein